MLTAIRPSLCVVLCCALLNPIAGAAEGELAVAVNAEHRTAAHTARDDYRHPLETLTFLGLRDDMTVVELSPGGGWYTEILAPYLRDNGVLYAANYDPDSDVEYYHAIAKRFLDKLAADPAVYDRVIPTVFDPPVKLDAAPAGSADMECGSDGGDRE